MAGVLGESGRIAYLFHDGEDPGLCVVVTVGTNSLWEVVLVEIIQTGGAIGNQTSHAVVEALTRSTLRGLVSAL